MVSICKNTYMKTVHTKEHTDSNTDKLIECKQCFKCVQIRFSPVVFDCAVLI